jgi:hypothetical protein
MADYDILAELENVNHRLAEIRTMLAELRSKVLIERERCAAIARAACEDMQRKMLHPS